MLHASNLYHTAPARALADALAERSFASKVFFCNSGAEANEGAFKFARRWALGIGGPAKHEIVALRGSFHGRLFASLAATDRPGYRAPFRPLAGGVAIVERDLTALDIALDAETVAALIVEPVQGEGGVRVLDGDFLRALRAMTRAREIALIFDEVQCGLGRTGYLFAYERYGVEPDMLTLAKPLAGGLPMGAVLLNEQIAAAVKPGDHATTFGGGPARRERGAARARARERSGAARRRARARRVARQRAPRESAAGPAASARCAAPATCGEST